MHVILNKSLINSTYIKTGVIIGMDLLTLAKNPFPEWPCHCFLIQANVFYIHFLIKCRTNTSIDVCVIYDVSID